MNLPQISPFLPKASVFRRNYPETTPKLPRNYPKLAQTHLQSPPNFPKVPETAPKLPQITPKLTQSARTHLQTSPQCTKLPQTCPNSLRCSATHDPRRPPRILHSLRAADQSISVPLPAPLGATLRTCSCHHLCAHMPLTRCSVVSACFWFSSECQHRRHAFDAPVPQRVYAERV